MLNKYKNIKSSFESLTERELGIVYQILKSGISSSDTEKQIYLKLFEIFQTDSIQDFNHLQKANKTNSFSAYLNRFENIILDSVTWEVSISGNERYANAAKNRFLVKKIFMQAQVFHGRGGKDLAVKLYKKGIRIAEEYELYGDLIELCKSLISLYEIQGKTRQVKEVQVKLKKAETCKKAVDVAEEGYRYLLAMGRVKKSAKSWDRVKKYIDELKYRYKISKSTYVLHHLTTIQSEYYKHISDFKKTDFYLRKLYKVLLDTPSLYLKRREGAVWLNLAENASFMYDFKQVIQYAQKARKLFVNPNNQSFAFYFEFYAHLRLFQYDKAMTILKVMSDDEYQTTSWNKGRRDLSLAWLYYKMGQIKSCQIQCEVAYPSIKNQPEWNVSYRVLQFLLFAEHQKFDLCLAEYENLKQYFNRNKVDQMIPKESLLKIKFLMQFLEEWINLGFGSKYSPGIKKILKDTKKLKSDFQEWEIIPLPILIDDLLKKR